MKVIILTGGGTAGHVMANIALIPYLKEEGWKIIYIGSQKGIERQLIGEIEGVVYYAIPSGKLKRYFSLENFKMPFQVLKGIYEAYKLIKKLKPHVIFSGGGYVSVPVVLGAWLNRVPSIIRETDYTCGLANKITLYFAKQICVTFPDTLINMPCYKRKYYGPIVRMNLLEGDAFTGLTLTQFTGAKPILLIMGGSQGAKKINDTVNEAMPRLVADFDIIHICGNGNKEKHIEVEGYKQYNYIGEELAHLYAIADVVVTRAGSNALFEGLVLRKPMLLLPLSKKVSRGDQILNAKYAVNKGYAKMILDEDLSANSLVVNVKQMYDRREIYRKRLNVLKPKEAIEKQLKCINRYSR